MNRLFSMCVMLTTGGIWVWLKILTEHNLRNDHSYALPPPPTIELTKKSPLNSLPLTWNNLDDIKLPQSKTAKLDEKKIYPTKSEANKSHHCNFTFKLLTLTISWRLTNISCLFLQKIIENLVEMCTNRRRNSMRGLPCVSKRPGFALRAPS